ncbi:hypothetical protein [Streptomyces ochraceiscleroticus]|uniref:Uncharacterized protein n=1 Tax=Streptomyces ochraceiscleroticus TaxID=47761 RepID=A0ABW1MFI6_9ACTN|nr:hypothetical protein [Streptomyces ochraceiscleroticus]
MSEKSHQGAFHDPETLRAWRRARRKVLWSLILLTVATFALVFLAVEIFSDTPTLLLCPLAIPPVLWIAARSRRQDELKGMKPILEIYPWQDVTPAPARISKRGGSTSGAQRKALEIPNPDEPGKNVTVIARRTTLGTKWRRTLAEASEQGFQFAGDPRFGGVIALRGRPDYLIAVLPRHEFLNVQGRPKGVSEAAWHRARSAWISGEPITAELVREFDRKGGRNA